jgi:hypothetical protein
MAKRKQSKLADENDGSVTVQPFQVAECQKLLDAMDHADDEAEGPKEMKAAAKETAKNKGYMVDALVTVQKLRRKKTTLEAQAWLEAVSLYAQAAGILDQTDLFRDFTAKASPPVGSTLN